MNVTGVHQIEITSRCNLRCRYCVHPTMPRAKQDMTWEVYCQALHWVKEFQAMGTQGELNLCGIGESTMHPQFAEFLRQARRTLGPAIRLVMATNGVGLTDEHAAAMRENAVGAWVSLHRPEKAGPSVNLLNRHGVLLGVSNDPSIAATDWAGQVKWEVTAPRPSQQCPWLRRAYVMVCSDGRVVTCSFDGQGKDGVLGTVFDHLPDMDVQPYSLCPSCYQFRPEAP